MLSGLAAKSCRTSSQKTQMLRYVGPAQTSCGLVGCVCDKRDGTGNPGSTRKPSVFNTCPLRAQEVLPGPSLELETAPGPPHTPGTGPPRIRSALVRTETHHCTLSARVRLFHDHNVQGSLGQMILRPADDNLDQTDPS